MFPPDPIVYQLAGFPDFGREGSGGNAFAGQPRFQLHGLLVPYSFATVKKKVLDAVRYSVQI